MYEKLSAQHFPSHLHDRSFFSLTGETDGQRATFSMYCLPVFAVMNEINLKIRSNLIRVLRRLIGC